jgi:hypothetical protein
VPSNRGSMDMRNAQSSANLDEPSVDLQLAMQSILKQVIALDLEYGINHQAVANMAMIPMYAPYLIQGGADSIGMLLMYASEHYAAIQGFEASSAGILFYSWYDAQAGRLRMSAISRAFASPPFRCDCDFDASVKEIERDCLAEISSLYGPRKALSVWIRRF